MKIKYIIGMIYSLVFVSPSLYSMNLLEKPVPCIPIVNVVNIVPGVIEPTGIGCTQNGIAVLEKDAFTVWDMTDKINVVYQKGQMQDFAINRKGTKVALSWGQDIKEINDVLSGSAFLNKYDVCSGEQEFCKNKTYLYFLPIAFNHKDEIVSYQAQNNKSMIYSQSGSRGVNWPDISLQANDSFAHHPSKEQIIFGVASNTCYCGNYQSENYVPFALSFSDNFFAAGQLYNSDGSYVVIVGRNPWETSIQFAAIDPSAPSFMFVNEYIDIELQKICVAMAFHPNNKLFFLLDENNIIDCFDFATKKCIHSMRCKGQKKIPVNENGLEKRLALSRDGTILYAALKDKVVAIAVDDRKQLFFMLSALMFYKHNNDLLPSDVVRIIMYNALKVSNVPLWNYLEK